MMAWDAGNVVEFDRQRCPRRERFSNAPSQSERLTGRTVYPRDAQIQTSSDLDANQSLPPASYLAYKTGSIGCS